MSALALDKIGSNLSGALNIKAKLSTELIHLLDYFFSSDINMMAKRKYNEFNDPKTLEKIQHNTYLGKYLNYLKQYDASAKQIKTMDMMVKLISMNKTTPEYKVVLSQYEDAHARASAIEHLKTGNREAAQIKEYLFQLEALENLKRKLTGSITGSIKSRRTEARTNNMFGRALNAATAMGRTRNTRHRQNRKTRRYNNRS